MNNHYAVTPSTDIYNEDVFKSIPVNAKKIVEIGTGSGALASKYRSINHSVNYIGVEIYNDYVRMSEKYCDKVYEENFEEPSEMLISEFSDAEVVIFADVLEHFKEPWTVLKRLNEWMSLNTMLIVCLPNIQHWSIQYQLLAGNFNYVETGLLDRTHLRFFTRKTAIELMENAGFFVESVNSRVFNFENQNIILKNIGAVATIYGFDPNECMSDASAFQYVITSRKI